MGGGGGATSGWLVTAAARRWFKCAREIEALPERELRPDRLRRAVASAVVRLAVKGLCSARTPGY